MFKSLIQLQHRLPVDVTKLTHLPRHVKLTALGVSLGFLLMGILAAFFRRRRRRAHLIQKKLQAKQNQRQQNRSHHRPGHHQSVTNNNIPNGGKGIISLHI